MIFTASLLLSYTPYYYDRRIHNLGNIGFPGEIHAESALLSTRVIDIIRYNGVNIRKEIIKTSFETGLYFYLYNEAAMIVLNKINPVTHAIVNTLKRIIILITCVIFFKTPLTKNGVIGSSIAIIGSYLYSKTKKIKA
ncbi:unnamed protein product [marine sediment metagenome]|uniref:Sugar phosphate transporter domain-containing protein n=1 Tax=marine sediment metagenome TaxID=412755 RepID=X1TWU3_9ZZZZ